MTDADKTIECVDCGTAFVFTAAERESFRRKGFLNEPKRCRRCRHAPRSDGPPPRPPKPAREPKPIQYAGSTPTRRKRVDLAPIAESCDVTCSQCGAATRVPFRPDGVRPVFCRNCFADRRRAGVHRAGPK